MPKIYVVMCEVGEYEETKVRNVCAFTEEEDARHYVETARAWIAANEKLFFKGTSAEPPAFDPGFVLDRHARDYAEYSYTPVPLDPPQAKG